MSRIGISGSYGCSIFAFLRNIHIVFHSGFTNFHSHQECRMIPFSPHPLQHFPICRLTNKDILTHVKWYLIVFRFVFHQVIISDLENFSIYLLDICISHWRTVYLVFCPFLNWVVCFNVELYELVYFEINPLSVASFVKISPML